MATKIEPSSRKLSRWLTNASDALLDCLRLSAAELDRGRVTPMHNRSLYYAALSLFGSLLAGCATTTPIINEWRNPAYASASFPRIMFGALGGDAATRRNFEDEFITQMRAVGAHGVASYRHIAEVGAADESTIKDAARQAGANALIIAKLVGVEERTQYSGPYVPYSWFGIYGSHGGVSMSGPGGAPIASRYLEYTTETALLDVGKNELVWTATTMARETAGSESAIKSTVQAVVKALVEKNLLGPPQ